MSTEPSKEDDAQPSLQWTASIDTMLANWADNAKCFEWMHNEAYARYYVRSTAMSITANISIALSGVANLIVGAMNPTSLDPPLIFGCISIGIGIINMLQDKFDWVTLANNFKHAAGHWSRIRINLEEQLAMPPHARKDCGTFLKYVKLEMLNTSPYNYTIPKDIRAICAAKFAAIPHFDIPDICGQLEHTTVYVADTAAQPLIQS